MVKRMPLRHLKRDVLRVLAQGPRDVGGLRERPASGRHAPYIRTCAGWSGRDTGKS